jgi:hypothetical protein
MRTAYHATDAVTALDWELRYVRIGKDMMQRVSLVFCCVFSGEIIVNERVCAYDSVGDHLRKEG